MIPWLTQWDRSISSNTQISIMKFSSVNEMCSPQREWVIYGNQQNDIVSYIPTALISGDA